MIFRRNLDLAGVWSKGPVQPYMQAFSLSSPAYEPVTTGSAVSFRCRLCGECCSSMGEIIEIREQTGPSAFRIGFKVTGEEQMVTIDPDKQVLCSRQDIRMTRPMACPFLREEDTGAVICTVHRSRPDLCRQYSCFRILVLDGEGKKIGRVMDGTRYFVSRDAGLKKTWDRECSKLDKADEACWEEEAGARLASAGYRVVR
ncbi:YkgJ family cysteine cluster protein [Methanoregula sp.]|jgi:uncharacterized protein|uniref:YkgJ family cysteine cluster protein n=1 Tax=Methanoregula sp. TaxID=2052170 RepID=UPI003C21B618